MADDQAFIFEVFYMSSLVIMFILGYVFHLVYKLGDKVFIILLDALRKKKNKDVV